MQTTVEKPNTITDISSLTGIAEQLSNQRDKVNRIKSLLEIEQNKKNELQEKLMQSMKSNKLSSIKTNTNTFSLVSKPEPKIVNEVKLIADLKARKLDYGLISTRVDSIKFKSLARSLLNQTGEVFDGTELGTSEYISIRSTQKKTVPSHA